MRLFQTVPFEIYNGTNYFQDEFFVLHHTATLEQYVELSELASAPESRRAAKIIADTMDEIGYFVRHIAVSLDVDSAPAPVPSPSPRITSATVERALQDAERLIPARGAASGVDRIHTAFHGFLRAVCDQEGIAYASDASTTALLKVLREKHPSLVVAEDPEAENVAKVIRAMGAITDALNPLRNNASLAHPNPLLLDEPEAMLVINAVRTLLHYLSTKLETQ